MDFVGATGLRVAVEPLEGDTLEARFGLLAREGGSHLLHVRWSLDAVPEGATEHELVLRLSALGQTAGTRVTEGVTGDLRDVFAAPRLVLDELAPYEPAPFEAPPRPRLERRGEPGREHATERLANELLAAFSLGVFRASTERLPPLTPESSAALGQWLEEVRVARRAWEAAEVERRAAYDARVHATHEANVAAQRAHELALSAHHDALAALAIELATPRCEREGAAMRCEGWAIWSAPPTPPESVAIWAHLDLHFGACDWHLVGHVVSGEGATWTEVLRSAAPEPRTIALGSVH